MKRIPVESQIVTRYGIIAGRKTLPLANANLKRLRTRVHARQGLWVCRRQGDSAAHGLSACGICARTKRQSMGSELRIWGRCISSSGAEYELFC